MAERRDPPARREAELALLLVGTQDRRNAVRERIAELATTADQRTLLAFLSYHRLLVLGGKRLLDTVPDASSADLRPAVEHALGVARRRAAVFSAACGRLLETLEAAGVAGMPLKGATLARELYGDEALRDYADIDLLVRAADLDDAVVLARRVGWTHEPHREANGRLPALHRVLVRPDGALPELELHWRIHWYETEFAERMLERSRMKDGIRQAEPVDQLAALLLFYARDGFAGLRLAADIAAWWDRHGSRETVPALQDLAARHPKLAETWRAGLTVATGVVGLPTGLSPMGGGPRTRRGMLACRLANWDLRSDPDQVMANVTLVDGLLTPRGGLLGFMRRQTLRRQGSAAGGVPAGPLAPAAERAAHFAKTIVRYAIALGRLRRGRCWSPLPAGALAGVQNAAPPPRLVARARAGR